jgi:hypothetical protein
LPQAESDDRVSQGPSLSGSEPGSPAPA